MSNSQSPFGKTERTFLFNDPTATGVKPDLLRLPVGIEDLKHDLKNVFNQF